MNKSFKVAEIKLVYKPSYKIEKRPFIKDSSNAYEILKQHWDLGLMQFIEQFKIILLSTSNRVLGIYEVSTGGINGVYVDQRVVFAAALKANASQIILAHNHPSGSLKPSCHDLELTKNLVECGKIMNIRVIEHIIITVDGYYSFCDEGIISYQKL